jgi:RNA polymerase sigma-70 factor, ECF subfamily
MRLRLPETGEPACRYLLTFLAAPPSTLTCASPDRICDNELERAELFEAARASRLQPAQSSSSAVNKSPLVRIRSVEMDDQEAIRRCKAGDSEAFGHLVARYQREAIGHARAILVDGEDARDAAQDAFIAAFRSLDRFDEGRRFYPWLYTILRNRCFKVIADRKVRRPASVGDLEVLAPSPGLAPEELLELERALSELRPEDREILTLRHLDGSSYSEIAEFLGIPLGTVMSRLFNARRKLRERLGRTGPRAPRGM